MLKATSSYHHAFAEEREWMDGLKLVRAAPISLLAVVLRVKGIEGAGEAQLKGEAAGIALRTPV